MLASSLFASPLARGLAALSFASFVFPSAAQGPTSEAGAAVSTDIDAECTNYYYAPTSAASSAGVFPQLWKTATILPGDMQAQQLFSSIQPNIPTTIQPKGNRNSSTAGVTYNPGQDPDCWWTSTKCVTPKVSGLPQDVFQVPEPMTVGYGFDDGPNCSHNAFYDFLQTQNQKATMFYIGSNVNIWPYQAQRAVADGHEICVHTWSHGYMTSFNDTSAFAELWYAIKAIKLVTGVTPRCWRPPYGDVDDRIRAIAHGLNLTTMVWGYDSNDWQEGQNGVTDQAVDGYYQNFVNNANNGTFNTHGGIILTHEINNYTMGKAIQWYPKLQAAFKYIVPVSVALNVTQPYVETNYSLPSFAQYVSGKTTANPSNASNSTSTSGGSSSGGNGTKSGALPTALPASARSAVVAMLFAGISGALAIL